MIPSSLRRLALVRMLALGAACAETPESETPDATQDDYIEALRTRNAWDAEAQNTLGLMCANGEGIQ
jgi:hypothetical protein